MRDKGFVSLPREYLIEKRKLLGYSVEVASRKLDISRFYYYQIENGNRGSKLTFELMLKLCEVLGIKESYFIKSEKEYLSELKALNYDYFKNRKERWHKKKT